MVTAYYIVYQDLIKYASRLYFMVYRSLMFVNFFADIILMLLISHLLLFGFGCISKYLKTITYITNIVSMLTSASLLLLLNASYAPLVILLLPVMVIVGIVFYKEIKIGQAHEVIDDEDYQSELKPFFDLSASVTNAAFGGMIGTIFGYFKNFPIDADEAPAKFFEAFIFLTVIFGLLAMLLTTLPLLLRHPNVKARFVSFIKVLSYTLLGLLALTGLAIACEFVGRFILLAFFPIFIAVAVWFGNEFMQDNRRSQPSTTIGHENELDTISVIITTITTFIFGIIMAVYTVYFTGEDYNFNIRVCMLLLSMAFMSSLSWMLLASRSLRTEGLEMIMKVLVCFTTGGLVLAMVGLILVGINL